MSGHPHCTESGAPAQKPCSAAAMAAAGPSHGYCLACPPKGSVNARSTALALQGLLDFCNQANFMREVYVNLDCRVERGNLFETVAAVLSKSSFPVNRPLAHSHVCALDGLFSVLTGLQKG